MLCHCFMYTLRESYHIPYYLRVYIYTPSTYQRIISDRILLFTVHWILKSIKVEFKTEVWFNNVTDWFNFISSSHTLLCELDMKLNQSGQHNRKSKIRFDIHVSCLFSCHPGSLNKEQLLNKQSIIDKIFFQ